MEETDRHVVVDLPFGRTVTKVVKALQQEDFVVATASDVREALRDRIGQDFRRYVLLVAYHPGLALQALRADLDAGVHLVCTFAIYEIGDGETVVTAADPWAEALASRDWRETQPALTAVAIDTEDRLARVLGTLSRRARAHAAVMSGAPR